MKRTRNQACFLAIATAFLAAAWGCGEGTPAVSSSSEKVQVKGTVTLKGKPLSGGQIIFDPANINRRDAPVATLELGKDGTFSGETLAGENAVMVHGPAIDKSPDLSANRQIIDLKSGENTVNIDL